MKMDNLKKRRRCLVIFLVIIILSIIGTVFIGFFACNDEICAFSTTKKLLLDHHHAHQFHQTSQLSHHHHHPSQNNVVSNSNFYNITSSNSHKQLDSHLLGLSYDEVLNDDFQSKFDINKFDVMVSNSTSVRNCAQLNEKDRSVLFIFTLFVNTFKDEKKRVSFIQ